MGRPIPANSKAFFIYIHFHTRPTWITFGRICSTFLMFHVYYFLSWFLSLYWSDCCLIRRQELRCCDRLFETFLADLIRLCVSFVFTDVSVRLICSWSGILLGSRQSHMVRADSIDNGRFIGQRIPFIAHFAPRFEELFCHSWCFFFSFFCGIAKGEDSPQTYLIPHGCI